MIPSKNKFKNSLKKTIKLTFQNNKLFSKKITYKENKKN